MHLNLLCVRNNMDLWTNHRTFVKAIKNGDSGLDIPFPEEIAVPPGTFGFPIPLGIKVETHCPFFLMPRSSIAKSPLRMSNSIGLIDRSYRGELIAMVDNYSDQEWRAERGTMLFQIVSFDGNTPTYTLVDMVANTERGDGGFGSTTDNVSAPSSESVKPV